MVEHMEDHDDIEALDSKETAHALPLGWVLLYVTLVIVGLVYAFSYLPATTGWTQAGEYEQSIKK